MVLTPPASGASSEGPARTYHGRFAPSPSGPLHFGSLVAAVASWLDARAVGGRWSVRIEDVDAPRTVPGAADAILRMLEACALEWDGPVLRQSERGAIYDQALATLRAAGEIYRCRCTRREIADSALRGIEGVVYPGTCRDLGLASEVPGALRLRVPPGIVAFEDRLQGCIEQDVAREVGDFVLERRDGLHAYQLAVVVDDAEQGITDVVRGADLLASTPRQILLQRALGHATPRYLHFPIAVDARGEKLSKQSLAPALDLQSAAAALPAALAFLGQEVPAATNARELLAEAARRWDPARIERVAARPFALFG
ncbi:MAG TPA: tRNA glutamyl-Q(34) synthetase GluQRS [Usitatibacter sp.]|nr:tRNA glutamyl-Q(34) synthetase GluQRS [Usitatibacter sp.]